jgi:hypothetical protein
MNTEEFLVDSSDELSADQQKQLNFQLSLYRILSRSEELPDEFSKRFKFMTKNEHYLDSFSKVKPGSVVSI